MNNSEQSERHRLRRARIGTILMSLIAVSSVALAIYAFQQKKKAEIQTALAEQKATEALQQQKIAVEQRNIADSNKEQAQQQREYAFENERNALEQKAIADSQSKRAEKSRLEAIEQQHVAENQKSIAEKQKEIAIANEQEASHQKTIADEQKSIVKIEKQTSGKLKELADSRTLANESVFLSNENLFDSSKSKALQAYMLNKNNDGPLQNSDIYDALNINWTKNINYRNQSVYALPVHCITGMRNNIVFTADENGMVTQSVTRNNTLQKVASYAIKEDVRALAVSPNGSKLVALTISGKGFLFTVSAAGITLLTNFEFAGAGKDVIFNSNESLIILTNKGIGECHITNGINENFFNHAEINAITVGRSGKFYIASGKEINIYNNWNDLMNSAFAASLKFDSKVTSIAVDDNEQCLAAGTYNGFVSITALKNRNEVWNRALHLSSVNDLEFAVVDNDILQLASAGADQTIKLINVKAILQKNFNEDIITLKGHTKWIYDLYYTPDGAWLFSTGEDKKVMACKTTVNDLYQTLNNQ